MKVFLVDTNGLHIVQAMEANSCQPPWPGEVIPLCYHQLLYSAAVSRRLDPVILTTGVMLSCTATCMLPA